MEAQEFTKYERARILGARGLQVSMDAPLLLKIDKKELEAMNFDPLKIAQKELDSGVLPITVKKPLPIRGDEKAIEKEKIDDKAPSDEKKIEAEKEEEQEILESGELLDLTDSDEEKEEKMKLQDDVDTDIPEPKLEED